MATTTCTVQTICTKVAGDHARVRMMDSLKLKKAGLKTACTELGLPSNGTRSNLCYRLARSL